MVWRVSPLPLICFLISLLIKCALLIVARLVRHTNTRSFFFFLLLAVSFQRCVAYREYPHYSRAFSPHLTLLFIARVLTSREDSHSSLVFSSHLDVCREDSHSSQASSSHLTFS